MLTKIFANSFENFIQELNDIKIYDQLRKHMDSSPHENYIFMKLIEEAKIHDFLRKQLSSIKRSTKKSK